MQKGMLFLLSTLIFSTQYTDALTPHPKNYDRRAPQGYFGGECCGPSRGQERHGYRYDRRHGGEEDYFGRGQERHGYRYDRRHGGEEDYFGLGLDERGGECYGGGCRPVAYAPRYEQEEINGETIGCRQPRQNAEVTPPAVTGDLPTICYTPYRYDIPRYECVKKCDEIPIYRKKKVCKMVPKYHDQVCWKYVPVSYTKRVCRYEPEYSYVDEYAYTYKRNRLEWQCRYESKYFYKRSSSCEGGDKGAEEGGAECRAAAPQMINGQRGVR